jgi:hypothetical protein
MVVAGSVDFLMRKEKKKREGKENRICPYLFPFCASRGRAGAFPLWAAATARQRGKGSGSTAETVTVAALYNF